MLSGKKIIKYTCVKKVALGLALSFALVLLAVPAAEETGGVSQLSHQEMEGLFGGLNTCCDDCRDVAMDYSECDHGNNYPSTANCSESACIRNFLITASCSPDHVGATGCDASQDYPFSYSLHQYVYAMECNWYEDEWSVFTKLYWGCDFGSLKLCFDFLYIKACDKAGDDCDGTLVAEYHKGLPKMACAICS